MLDRFEAVSFDLYGTLITTDPGLLPVMTIDGVAHATPLASSMAQLKELRPGIDLGDALASYAAALAETRDTLRRRDHRELPADYTFRLCLERLRILRNGDSALLQQAFQAACINAARPLPNAKKVLRRTAAAGRRIGIISNLPDTNGWQRISHILGTPRLDFVVLSGDVGWRKPSPRIFSAAMAALNLPGSRILHLGDEFETDIVGASAAGMGTAWLSRTDSRFNSTSDMQLGSLDELLPLL